MYNKTYRNNNETTERDKFLHCFRLSIIYIQVKFGKYLVLLLPLMRTFLTSGPTVHIYKYPMSLSKLDFHTSVRAIFLRYVREQLQSSVQTKGQYSDSIPN